MGKRISMILNIVLTVMLFSVWQAYAGIPAGPGTPPASTSSYTLADIYNRLNDGTAGSQSTFTEPSVAPGTGTMHTLNEIMDKAPTVDDTNGATAANVESGKTFWGLTSGGWGLQTGTATVGSNVTGTNGNLSMTIPNGFYSGSKTATAQDSDLVADKIKKDVDIFGVTGTFEGGPTCSGTLNGTRWCNNGDGTVTDMTTGLVWLKKADWGGTRKIYESGGAGVENAHDRASSLKAGATGAGLTDESVEGDWRLPTRSELYGLANGTEAVRSNNMRAFTGVQANFYWSSSSYMSITTYGQYIRLVDGVAYSGPKTGTNYVWPVRGGQ